jgi:hypothetical protein
MPNKFVKGDKKDRHKQVVQTNDISTDRETPIWSFDNVDNAGVFRFGKDEVNTELIVDKILSLSKMKWIDIKKATHDDGKSKNHELDYEGISDDGKNRINAKQLTKEDIDTIFSLAFTNKIRVIGLKKGRIFHVMWYDPNHDFYPVNK